MGTLTDHVPKPLINVAGRPLLDFTLEIASSAKIAKIVVNAHYLANQIVTYLTGRDVTISIEHDQILETGGGLKAALPLLGNDPVLTLNSDAVWTGPNPLDQLMRAWDGTKMDCLLLVLPANNAAGHGGFSDFLLGADGQLSRANGDVGYVYLGAQIIRTDGLIMIEDAVFSLNVLWDHMIASGRAFGLVHAGGWCDVGTPQGIIEAEAMLADVRHV